jgi:hypothetical protein
MQPLSLHQQCLLQADASSAAYRRMMRRRLRSQGCGHVLVMIKPGYEHSVNPATTYTANKENRAGCTCVPAAARLVVV